MHPITVYAYIGQKNIYNNWRMTLFLANFCTDVTHCNIDPLMGKFFVLSLPTSALPNVKKLC